MGILVPRSSVPRSSAPRELVASEPRWSGFCPPMLPRLLAWYDLSQEGAAADAAIGTLRDWAGNGNAAAAAGAGTTIKYRRPPFGLPCAICDGTARYFRKTLAFAYPVTIYAVARLDASPSAGANFLLDGAGAAGSRVALFNSAGRWAMYAGSQVLGGNVTGRWQQVDFTHTGGADSVLGVDGTETTGNAGSNAGDGFTVGGNFGGASNWQGAIAEVIVFKGAHDASTRALVRDYLKQKWGRYFTYNLDDWGAKPLWFEAETESYADADPVSTATNRGTLGAAGNATQTNGQRPVWKAGILNGRAVYRFDGTDDCLVTAAFTALPQPNTIVVVGKRTAKTSLRYLCDGIDIAARHAVYEDAADKDNIYGGSLVTSAGALADTSAHVWVGVMNGASGVLYRDGLAAASGDVGAHSLTGLTIGGRYNAASTFNGDIPAIGVYARAFTALEAMGITQDLRRKYGF